MTLVSIIVATLPIRQSAHPKMGFLAHCFIRQARNLRQFRSHWMGKTLHHTVWHPSGRWMMHCNRFDIGPDGFFQQDAVWAGGASHRARG